MVKNTGSILARRSYCVAKRRDRSLNLPLRSTFIAASGQSHYILGAVDADSLHRSGHHPAD